MKKVTANPSRPAVGGGLSITWVLGDTPRTVKTRKGDEKTLIDLRDPRRLSYSLTLWLDGPAGTLANVQPGVLVQLQLESVRSGRSRYELVGTVSRAAVEAALSRAAEVRP